MMNLKPATFAMIATVVSIFIGTFASASPNPFNQRESNPDRYSAILDFDIADPLIQNMTPVYRLSEMEERGLLKGEATTKPWSDTYWPTMKGGLGWRYTDTKFPNDTKDFNINYQYYLATPADGVDLNSLSPSEKYDFLLGDRNFTLTKAYWQRGVDHSGPVALWEGLCDGWAAASVMEKEPRKSVTVQTPTGESITFYPSDIKALVTASWTFSRPKSHFVGSRCFDEMPDEDEIGRAIDPDCLTTNPGTWHITAVNRLGVAGKSFVMDATYNQEVWNHPVSSYSYSYFNVASGEVSESLTDAVTPVKRFRRDKYASHRHPQTEYLVGIRMTVQYATETYPAAVSFAPKYIQREYVYDLELDSDFKILGGEWYNDDHPDFVWAPTDGSMPLSNGERGLPPETSWKLGDPIPQAYLDAAKVNSTWVVPPSKRPRRDLTKQLNLRAQPVWGIVRELLKASQIEETQP